MMSELFDEQAQRDDYNAARDKEVRAEEKLAMALNMLSLGTISKEDIAKVTGFTVEKIREPTG